MAKFNSVPRQRVFEARYEQGYRYLDRCGEVLVILEDLLPQVTKHVWLVNEISLSGARLNCPDLDINLVFGAFSVIVDQNPIGDTPCDFHGLAAAILATLVGRLDPSKMRRFGFRRMDIIPAQSDSFEGAQQLSLRVSPVQDWLDLKSISFEPREFHHVSVYELPDCSKGMRVTTQTYNRVSTEIRVDERLKGPPHHLAKEQHQALIEQLKRAKTRRQDPEAGVLLDIDYYWMWPPKGAIVRDFIAEAQKTGDLAVARLLLGR